MIRKIVYLRGLLNWIKRCNTAEEQIRVTAAPWKDFTSHLVLESLHQEVLGQVARDEDIWGSLGLQAATTVHRWLKARNGWIMMGRMSVY